MFREPIFDKIKLPAIAAILALLLGLTAFAEVVDPGQAGSIEVTLRSEETGKPISGGSMTLYQVGKVAVDDWNYSFELTDGFAESGFSLDDLKPDGDPELAKDFADYVNEHPQAGKTVPVNDDGMAVFKELENGLYLCVQTEASKGYYPVNPFLVSVPRYDTDTERYVYDIDASPKTEPADTDLEFFDLEEWIVPDNDETHPDSWIRDEGVNELDWIEIEMNTTLPVIPPDVLESDSAVMTFHHRLSNGLDLDTDPDHFKIFIGDTNITDYCIVNTLAAIGARPISGKVLMAAGLNPLASLIQTYSVDDGCDFHVTVDLSELYGDKVISADDLGTAVIRVFFYVDLEEDVDIQREYTSSVRYEVQVVNDDGEVVAIYEPTDWKEVYLYTFEFFIYKYDADSEAPLAGATFGVYSDPGCENLVTRGGRSFTGTSDVNGEIFFEGLGDGTYYIKEISAPGGYKQDDAVEERTLNINTTPGHINTYEFANAKAGGTSPRPGGGGGGGSGSGSHSPGMSSGGPGVGEGEPDTGSTVWELLPLPQTGQGRAMLAAVVIMIIAGAAMIVALSIKRKG